ncbi:putative ubiquitinyl hydrolase 1 [Rosa chinensis]|uniref:Putative ubiquitinyl hydrolase 1 n=1 Tax=Rosa chinensis TaxID=74649 RepID=A0A2P6S0V7_ROSCH|nr:putative ubiquitinyl hydrolase 1 [Rosa chinensis]
MMILNSGFMMENEVSCLPHTPEEEKRIIDELGGQFEANVKQGNLFYVISNRWYSSQL